jgi:5-methylcytosine-specific restriction endonuclease McrA
MALKDPVKRAAYHAAWRVTHREELAAKKAAYARIYNPEHRSEARAYASAYHDSHRAEHAAFSANRRAARLGITGRLTGADIRSLWERQPTCVRCGGNRGVDHIVALTDGGLNAPENLQTLCLACNTHKEQAAVRLRSSEWRERLRTPRGPQARVNMRTAAIARFTRPGSRETLSRPGCVNACKRWNIGRGKPCICGEHVAAHDATSGVVG